jgi:hypothetical protein
MLPPQINKFNRNLVSDFIGETCEIRDMLDLAFMHSLCMKSTWIWSNCFKQIIIMLSLSQYLHVLFKKKFIYIYIYIYIQKNGLGQWFSTFVRPRPANFFFYKTRAQYNWYQGPVPGRGPAVEKQWPRLCPPDPTVFTVQFRIATSSLGAPWQSRSVNGSICHLVAASRTRLLNAALITLYRHTVAWTETSKSMKSLSAFMYSPQKILRSYHTDLCCVRNLHSQSQTLWI